MKAVNVLLVIVLLGCKVVAKDIKNVDKDKEECIEELKLDYEEIMKLDALDLPPDNNTDFNKFVSCDSKKKGLMAENGEILFDAIEKSLSVPSELKNSSHLVLYAYKSIVSSIINQCKSTPMIKDSGKNMIHIHACFFMKLTNKKAVGS